MLPLSDVKARLSEIAEEVDRTHERVHITRNGREYVVLLAAEDLEGIEASLELLPDPAAQQRIAQSRQEIAQGGASALIKSNRPLRSASGSADVSYQVVVSPTASRQLQERLPEAVAWACHEFIRGPLAEDPQRVGAPLRSPFDGLWRARRGEYRVRYTIDEDSKQVHVLDIGHRCGAYHR